MKHVLTRKKSKLTLDNLGEENSLPVDNTIVYIRQRARNRVNTVEDERRLKATAEHGKSFV